MIHVFTPHRLLLAQLVCALCGLPIEQMTPREIREAWPPYSSSSQEASK